MTSSRLKDGDDTVEFEKLTTGTYKATSRKSETVEEQWTAHACRIGTHIILENKYPKIDKFGFVSLTINGDKATFSQLKFTKKALRENSIPFEIVEEDIVTMLIVNNANVDPKILVGECLKASKQQRSHEFLR